MKRMRLMDGLVRMKLFLRKIFPKILMTQSMMRTPAMRICLNTKKNTSLTM